MTAYLPTIHCGKCDKDLPYAMGSVMRIQQGRQRFLVIRCHGEEQRIGFSEQSGRRITVWPQGKTTTPSPLT